MNTNVKNNPTKLHWHYFNPSTLSNDNDNINPQYRDLQMNLQIEQYEKKLKLMNDELLKFKKHDQINSNSNNDTFQITQQSTDRDRDKDKVGQSTLTMNHFNPNTNTNQNRMIQNNQNNVDPTPPTAITTSFLNSLNNNQNHNQNYNSNYNPNYNPPPSNPPPTINNNYNSILHPLNYTSGSQHQYQNQDKREYRDDQIPMKIKKILQNSKSENNRDNKDLRKNKNRNDDRRNLDRKIKENDTMNKKINLKKLKKIVEFLENQDLDKIINQLIKMFK